LGFAYSTSRDGKNVVIKDGIEISESKGFSPLVYTPDGKVLMFSDSKNNVEGVNRNGILSSRYPSMFYLTSSPDSKGFAFMTLQNGKAFAVFYSPKPKDATSPVSPKNGSKPKGTVSAVSPKNGSKPIATTHTAKISDPYDDATVLSYSPNGKELLFHASLPNNGGWRVVKDAVLTHYSDFIYSPDGKSSAYVDAYDDKVVKDGKKIG
jgi:hypothetical protein